MIPPQKASIMEHAALLMMYPRFAHQVLMVDTQTTNAHMWVISGHHQSPDGSLHVQYLQHLLVEIAPYWLMGQIYP